MAQVRARSGHGGNERARGGEARARGPLAALRVQDVPKATLVVLALLFAGAVAACCALWGTLGSQATYVRTDRGGNGAMATSSQVEDANIATTPAESPGRSAAVEAAPAAITVDVDGAVATPGVYELAEGTRVKDAVTKAGGLAEDADTTSVNLAQKLQDGQKVVIPRAGESVPAATAAVPEAGAGTPQGGLVNINTADAAELDTLPGVGESTARAIVEDRERNGPFASPEDLMRVSGIGEKKFAKLQALICV